MEVAEVAGAAALAPSLPAPDTRKKEGAAREDARDASEREMPVDNAVAERIERRKREVEEELQDLDRQTQQLKEDTHPEVLRYVRKLDDDAELRIHSSDQMVAFHKEMLGRLLVSDRKKARADWEVKQQELKKRWQTDLEKEKMLLKERHEMLQIDGDVDSKMRTRLRRHREEEAPTPKASKREPPGPTLVWELPDADILQDLTSLFPPGKRPVFNPMPSKNIDAYYDADRLFYDGKWFYRGGRVAIEWQDGSNQRIVGVIHSLNQGELWIRRQDNMRTRIFISQLNKGKYSIKHSQGKVNNTVTLDATA